MAEENERVSEEAEAEERSAPSGRIVYKAIVSEGEEELARPSSALFWSGLAAGLSMGFSMIAEALLTSHLPRESWAPLVTKLGYSVGFLVVILGRQQLFTENTLTPILPLLQHKTLKTLRNVARLWSVVLVANLIGAMLVALVAAKTSAFEPETQSVFAELGREALQPGFATIMLRGVFAGWLIALIVWLLPFAESARVGVIVIITYVIGLAHFSHVIAGAVVAFTTALLGAASWGEVLGGFMVPCLIGNIVGGVILVAALNHGQVVAGREDQPL